MRYRRRRKKNDSGLTTLVILLVVFLAAKEHISDILPRDMGDVGFTSRIVGTTYYVAKDGSDENEGTKESPFKTITMAVTKMEPGDGVIVKEGTYHEKITVSKKGTRDKTFTIKGEGNVVIDGQGGGGTLLTIAEGASYISIEGLTFKNLNEVDARGVCVEAASNHIQFLGCYFENIKTPHPSHKYNTANAIYLHGSGKTEEATIDNVLIKGGGAKNIGAGWSEVYSVDGNCTNVVLDGITVEAPDVMSNIAICICGHDKDTNSNPEVNRPRHVTVKNCKVSGCRSPYGDDAYGVYGDGVYDLLIYNNIISSSEGGIEIGAEHETSTFKGRDTEKVVVEKNKIVDCKKAIYVGGFNDKMGYAYDVTLKDNEISNSGKVTLDKCKKVTLSNNTLNGSEVKKTHRAEEVEIN